MGLKWTTQVRQDTKECTKYELQKVLVSPFFSMLWHVYFYIHIKPVYHYIYNYSIIVVLSRSVRVSVSLVLIGIS